MMTVDRLAKADRLAAITQRIGFALWQLQELEWATANYLVIRLHAGRGIGGEARAKLFQAAEKRTFGSLLKELTDKDVVDRHLAERLKSALGDRNWLVHRSRHDNHGVLVSDKRCASLIAKVDQISDIALALLREVGQLVEKHAGEAGVSKDFIDRESERLLVEWGILE